MFGFWQSQHKNIYFSILFLLFFLFGVWCMFYLQINQINLMEYYIANYQFILQHHDKITTNFEVNWVLQYYIIFLQ